MQKFSFPKTQNRQLIFSPKIQYELAAKRSEAVIPNLPFSKVCSILEIVRTVFAAAGGEESPREKAKNAAEPHP